MDKRIFGHALSLIMHDAFGNWEDNANAIEIDILEVWELYIKLKGLLILQGQNDEPVNFPRVHHMTAAEFVQNMRQTYGFEP